MMKLLTLLWSKKYLYMYALLVASLCREVTNMCSSYDVVFWEAPDVEEGAPSHKTYNNETAKEQEPLRKLMGPSWLQANHNNSLYPTDIFCQPKYSDIFTQSGLVVKNEKKDLCFRRCEAYDGTPRNRIILAPFNSAGLNDRIWVFQVLAELAGYLCANVYVPPPNHLLNIKHNNRRPLAANLKFSDFHNITFNNGELAVLDNTANEVKLTQSYLDTIHKGGGRDTDGLVWRHLRSVAASQSISEQFDKALRVSMSSSHLDGKEQEPNRFVWHIDVNLYKGAQWALSQKLMDIERASRPDQFYLPLTHLGGPERSPHSYISETHIPNKVNNIASMFWDHVLKETLHGGSFTWTGSWHIRRGDTKKVCNTSIPRLESYISCTFGPISRLLEATNNTTSQMAVLAHSDETDPHYWADMQDAFAVHAPNARMIVLDSAVLDFVRHLIKRGEIPFGYDNNYHIFMIVQAVVDTFATDFHLSHRRHYDCRDCFDLSLQLSDKKAS